ncbi:importin-11-like isoform X1 [Zingiber officinale]|uniref:importin-11-like isoform X1 n=2 Tax=Zingiber officinale TaxID=94328 RepID=UPI001C4CB9AC|nr:importin-11-like isoform X1 [Zingiber officinale]XP_042421875.1 importin-11-like isoform X1 [Zingiber officinale]
MSLSAADLHTVYSFLSNALSIDESTRKQAESALAQCENRPGFCSCLLEIIAARDSGCRDDARLLASVYFKNSISRYWRHRRDTSGISNDEKNHIRTKLLLHLREENTQIAIQLAVLVAKIARIDYPKEWPELFSILGQQLQSPDTLTSHRVFMVLFRTLKELSTKRLNSDQKTFHEIASQLFEFTWNLWKNDVQTILQTFSTISQSVITNSLVEHGHDLIIICERWLLCLKIIRQLIISGYPSDTTSAQEVLLVKEVCPVLLSAIQSFLPYYPAFRERQVQLCDFTKRSCTKLVKTLVVLQARHPYSFGDQTVLPAIIDFSLNMITNPDATIVSFEQFLIQCMVLVKSVLECKEYKPSLTGRVISESAASLSLEQRKKNISTAVSEMIKTILPSDRVILLCNVLIRRYFIFSAKDMDEWHQNPENFHHDQDMVQWTERLRPCAEALYIVLFENYKDLLSPIVVSILNEAMSGSPPLETEISHAMLLKDAAYTAAGHVYYELSNFLNFSDWFQGSLSIELSNKHPNMCIIHRKIAFILGQWASEIKGDTRKLVYHALIRLLQDNDIAVKLAACRSLCYLVQDTNFSEHDFSEHLPTCWSSCFKLMEEVEEFDSKVQVLNLISVLIDHVGDKVLPYASQLSNFFCKIWEESTGESLLQIQLLVALRNFVCSLGHQSSICSNLLLPILKSGINIDNPDSLNLLEDSILLLEATLSNAPSMVPQLFDFFPYLVVILERSFDYLQVATSIIEEYIIFGGIEFLNRHVSSLAKILDHIVGSVNEKGMLSTLPAIDLLVQCFPTEAPPLIAGVLQKLILICLSQQDGDHPSRTTVVTSSAAILARVLVMNTNYFAQLVSEPALQQSGFSVNQNILLALADIWVDKIDSATVIQRKIYALALCIMLTLRMPQIIDILDDILSACTGVILGGGDETTTSEDDSGGDTTSSLALNSDGIGYAGISSKDLRMRQIKDSDPIRQFSLENMLNENLKACAAFHGDASFNAAISRIHPSAFAQLQQALKM